MTSALADVAFEEADRRRLADRGDQRRHDRGAGHVAADVDDAALGMGGLARHGEMALEVAVEGHAVVEEIVDARRRVARPSGGRSSRRRCRRRRRSCRRDASRSSRPAPWRRRCRPAPRPRTRPRPIGAAVRTVTGRGARRSAQNRPASPPPTMMTSSEGSMRSRGYRHATSLVRRESRRPHRRGRFARRWIPAFAGMTTVARARAQLFRLIMRSTARRALAATSGSTVTSSFR